MPFKTKIFALLLTIACALPAALSAQQKMTFSDLDPEFLAALQRVISAENLKELGLKSLDEGAKSLLVSVEPSDCPTQCDSELRGGICQCKAQAEGGCGVDEAPAKRDGVLWCRTYPGEVKVFASAGGLGSTRVSFASAGGLGSTR